MTNPIASSEANTRQELPNGIVVLVRENCASPSVIVNGRLVVGAYDRLGDD